MKELFSVPQHVVHLGTRATPSEWRGTLRHLVNGCGRDSFHSISDWLLFVIVIQMTDVFDSDQFVVGPYDWRRCTTYLTRYINYPDEYFRQVNLCPPFWQLTLPVTQFAVMHCAHFVTGHCIIISNSSACIGGTGIRWLTRGSASPQRCSK